MYPNDKAAAFMIDFFDKNKTDPQTWVRGVTFEDVSVISAKSIGHFNGPGKKKVFFVHLLYSNAHFTKTCSGNT